MCQDPLVGRRVALRERISYRRLRRAPAPRFSNAESPRRMPLARIEIHGYAIVTDDDRIAGADGATPAGLRNEADWLNFQHELDLADLIVLGRLGHQANPNLKGRRRLVVSNAARGLEARDGDLWWRPAATPWSVVSQALLPAGGRVAVPGGQGVFDLFLSIGYEAFHLTRGHGVLAPGGRALFSACDSGMSAEAVLTDAGLTAGETRVLDAGANVTLTVWRKD
jgi:hypothetical protein